MNLAIYVEKWGTCNFDKDSVHNEDLLKLNNYPFKEQWHKCIGIKTGYLIVKFSCIDLRLKPSAFVEVLSPDFMPFDNVSYISSKGKLEIGTVVSYSTLRKPTLRNVYMLSVKGKVKSTLYEKDRLTLIEDTEDVKRKQKSLSKLISYVLRHKPDKYGLKLDSEGWTEMKYLIQALRQEDIAWQSLMYYDILRMIDSSEKKRHEVKTQRISPEYKNTYKWFIRAKYGHSFERVIYQERVEPPEILYHGTTDRTLEIILNDGLKPMKRQYVHLSENIDEAIRVGKRRQESPLILKIEANEAFKNNINFYHGDGNTWLSDEIAPKYIKLIDV